MSTKSLGPKEIMELLPHRYPFLMVDKVLEVDCEKQYIKALKNVTHNEPFFQGHFPEDPLMPGVMMVEAMAQVGGLFVKVCFPEAREKPFVLAGLDKVRFRRPVLPGDTIIFEAQGFKCKGPVVKTLVRATVDGKVVAEAEIMAAVR
ncbi:(3R)-hydroxymyristoyl-[acyl carrier protein] dehydratase [Thermosulfurimonas dismutans]|uniref:3-hydroxyacyl-[acyl-carrier-protein] dehydratase FabZ n=2 Tax=Thermosulfurimonas dismutans TaxID=999894 RepID=A0A179D3N1_9BACT|nr:3-hydroxyacyl-ACP dehydratase FabZ [Thermosulfurimonas dismutans]OAQ20238.1 (3R)-hydroxymyristoyl-[acyl carrier protein] dehydratase [Thermosulfurimonas dismutans]